MTVECQVLLTRDFDKSAVSALGAAARSNGAVEPSRVVGPDDDPSAIAARDRVGIDGHVLADEGTVGVLLRTIPLEIATDEDCAAARVSGRVYPRAIE